MGLKSSKAEKVTEEASLCPLTDPVFAALATETLVPYPVDDFPLLDAVQFVLCCQGADMTMLHRAPDSKEEAPPDHSAPSVAGPRDNVYNKRWQTAKQVLKREASGYDEFTRIYLTFLRDVVRKDLGEDMVLYQRIPTLRVHLAGAPAIGRPHRDADYRHTAFELNYWLPLSNCHGANSLWIESERGRGDFHPIVAEYGQVVRFYGNQVWHYTVRNDSEKTRVSFDFRVIRFSDFYRAGVPVDYSRASQSRDEHRKKCVGGQFCLGSFYGLMGADGEVPRDTAEGLCTKLGLL